MDGVGRRRSWCHHQRRRSRHRSHSSMRRDGCLRYSRFVGASTGAPLRLLWQPHMCLWCWLHGWGTPGSLGTSTPLDGTRPWHSDTIRARGLKNDSRRRFYLRKFRLALKQVRRGQRWNGYRSFGFGLHAWPQDFIAHGFIQEPEHWFYPTILADMFWWPGLKAYWGVYGGSGWPGYGRRKPYTCQMTRRTMRYFKRRV